MSERGLRRRVAKSPVVLTSRIWLDPLGEPPPAPMADAVKQMADWFDDAKATPKYFNTS